MANTIGELKKKIECIVKSRISEKKQWSEMKSTTLLEFEHQQLNERLIETDADVENRILVDEKEDRLTKIEAEVKDSNKKQITMSSYTQERITKRIHTKVVRYVLYIVRYLKSIRLK